MIFNYIPQGEGAYIHGFDYSEQAIQTAQFLFPKRLELKDGVIGKTEYPEDCFEVIASMDTMYFAKDMIAFVA